MNVHEIIRKLIGPIDPVGETNADTKRLANMKATTGLVWELITELRQVAVYSTRKEWSMKEIGLTAYKFLKMVREELQEDVPEIPEGCPTRMAWGFVEYPDGRHGGKLMRLHDPDTHGEESCARAGCIILGVHMESTP